MKKIHVDLFTFEVARALDKKRLERTSEDPKKGIRRLVAIILALKEAGFVLSEDDEQTTWINFSEEAKELRGDVPDERLWELAKHEVRFSLSKSEMSRSVELSSHGSHRSTS